jgi:hypothetical protein
MSSAFDFQFTSVQVYVQSKPGGTPTLPAFAQSLQDVPLNGGLDDRAFSSKKLKFMHSLGEISKYACSDDVVCQVSSASILVEWKEEYISPCLVRRLDIR